MFFMSVELAELARTEKQIQERHESRVGYIDAWHFFLTTSRRGLIIQINHFTHQIACSDLVCLFLFL